MVRRDEGDSYEGNDNDGNDLDSMNVKKKKPEEHIPAWLTFCLILLYYAIWVSVRVFCFSIELYARYINSVQGAEKVTELANTVADTVSTQAEEEDTDVPDPSSVHPLEIKDSVVKPFDVTGVSKKHHSQEVGMAVTTTGENAKDQEPIQIANTVRETVSQQAEEEDTDVPGPSSVHPLEIKDSVAVATSDSTTSDPPVKKAVSDPTTTVKPFDVPKVFKKEHSQEIDRPVTTTAEGDEDGAEDQEPPDKGTYPTAHCLGNIGYPPLPVKGPPDKTSNQNTSQASQLRSNQKQETMEESKSDQCTVANSLIPKADKGTSAPKKVMQDENKLVSTSAQTEGIEPTEQPSLANESQSSGIQEMEQADGYEDTGSGATVLDSERDSPEMVAGVLNADINLGAPKESLESAPVNHGSVDSIHPHGREPLVNNGGT